MPFKSQAQRRYFAWKAEHSKTWKKRFAAWQSETGKKEIAEKEKQLSQIDNKNRVKRRGLIDKRNEDQRLLDMDFVMSHPEGRRIMNDLLSRCGVGRLSVRSLSHGPDGIAAALQTYFNEGQRNIGNFYWKLLTENFKEKWLLMTQEKEDKERAQAQEATSNGGSISSDDDRGGNDDSNGSGT